MKYKLSNFFNILSILSIAKIINFKKIHLSYLISRIFKKSFHWGMPVSASIEITTNCNLRCPECPSGLKILSRNTGSVEITDFQKYLDQLEKHLIYLILYFQGEPYLNKHFFEIIKYAKSKKIFTATSTNGHFLDYKTAHQTVASGLDRLIISLDGTDQETYSSYRVNGDFNKVISGIKNMVLWKEKMKSKTPFIILQFLVLKTNEHQIESIEQLSKQLGVDELQLKSAQVYDYENDNSLIPDNIIYSRYVKDDAGKYHIKNKLSNHCFRMWQSLVITWDGNIVPCCFDKDAQHILGNLKTTSLKEILKSKKYNSFRKNILKNRGGIEICRNCSEG
ncbi:MAG: radical SAM protein [Bacteroidetes bacterium]|nr:radical SAM protein [Bacteroidota bacterium]